MNMPEFIHIRCGPRAPLFSTRKIVHMSMLIFAFLLPYLTWTQAAGCALLALLFNVVVLPRLGMDLRKSPAERARRRAFGPALSSIPSRCWR